MPDSEHNVSRPSNQYPPPSDANIVPFARRLRLRRRWPVPGDPAEDDNEDELLEALRTERDAAKSRALMARLQALRRAAAGITVDPAGRLSPLHAVRNDSVDGDPPEPGDGDKLYGKGKRESPILRLIRRGNDGRSQGDDGRPIITLDPPNFHRAAEEAERMLIKFGDENPDYRLYQHDERVVRPVLAPQLASHDRTVATWSLKGVDAPYLFDVLSRAMRFQKWDKRSHGYVFVPPHGDVIKSILGKFGHWRLPIITSIVTAPYLRADGSICEQPGYDPTTGLLYQPGAAVFPPVPPNPARDDALAALNVLWQPFCEFPFADDASKSVVLAGCLTPLCRHLLATVPLFAVSSPVAGSGKSMIVDLTAIINTGDIMPVLSAAAGDEKELEKRIGAAMIAGRRLIALDNVNDPLRSALLAQISTQQQVDVRVLGLSRNVMCPTGGTTVFITGISLVIEGNDLPRRTVYATIDPKMERPETRTFGVADVVGWTKENRPMLVVAALTVLSAWRQACTRGEHMNIVPFGSYIDWSKMVREALIWLGCADPYDTVKKLQEENPTRKILQTIHSEWARCIGFDEVVKTEDIIEVATKLNGDRDTPSQARDSAFYNALLRVTGIKDRKLNANLLTRWINANRDVIADGIYIMKTGTRHGYDLWILHRDN
jgi:putative DNA primase/helicase